MTFDDAFSLVMYQGKRVRRKDWNGDLVVCKKRGKLVCCCTDDMGDELVLPFVDFDGHKKEMMADDWEEVKIK